MVIQLPASNDDAVLNAERLTPKEIVRELDKYIVGQHAAKRAVAIALRNRWRRQQLPPELRDEIAPKNIIMIGPTGVGKTEIARRLARLTRSPFLKIEASKFTEVGYVGRDVESIVRDLTEIGVKLVKDEKNKHGPRARRAQRARAHPRHPPSRLASAARAPGIRRRTRAGRLLRRRRARSSAAGSTKESSTSARSKLDVKEQGFPSLRDLHAAGRRRDGRQHEGHAARHLRRQDRSARRCASATPARS